VDSRHPICGMGVSAPSTLFRRRMDGERIIAVIVGVLVGVIFIVVLIRTVGGVPF